ncbi:MAG: hypothetical protein AAFV53_09055 [Myxococcota bacterium]
MTGDTELGLDSGGSLDLLSFDPLAGIGTDDDDDRGKEPLEKLTRKTMAPARANPLTEQLREAIDKDGDPKTLSKLEKVTRKIPDEDLAPILDDTNPVGKKVDKTLLVEVGPIKKDKIKGAFDVAVRPDESPRTDTDVGKTDLDTAPTAYDDASAGFKLCTSTQAWIRDPDKNFKETGASIPPNTLCKVLETSGKRSRLQYTIMGQTVEVWTNTSNLKTVKTDDLDGLLESARERARIKSGYFCTAKAATLYDKDFNKIGTVPAGALGKASAVYRPNSKSTDYFDITVTDGGKAVSGYIAVSATVGQSILSKDDFQKRKAQRIEDLSSQPGEYTVDEMKASLSGEDEVGDDEIVKYREERRAAMADQPGDAIHTHKIDAAQAFPAYQPVLGAHSDVLETVSTTMVKQLNDAVFASPGQETAPDQGVSITPERVMAIQQDLLNRYAATYWMEDYHNQLVAYWSPKIVKFIPMEDENGLVGKMRKNPEWKKLRKAQRKQRLQEWNIVEGLHKIIQWKQKQASRLDEVEWMLNQKDTIASYIQSSRNNISFTLTPRLPVEPADAPALPDVDTLDGYVDVLTPHMSVLGSAGFSVDAEEKNGLFSADVVNKTLIDTVLPAVVEYTDEGATAKQLARDMGLSVDWAMSWDSGAAVARGKESEAGVSGFLTVLGIPGIQELEMPMYDSMVGGSVIRKLHLGDRLPWTGNVQMSGREPWVEIDLGDDEGTTGWVQARYTNSAAVSTEIVERQSQEAADRTRLESSALDISARPDDKAAFADTPAGLSARGFLVLRDAGAGTAYSDAFATAGDALQTPAWELLVEVGPQGDARREIYHQGKILYIDDSAVREPTDVDLLMNTTKLSLEQVRQVRAALLAEPYTREKGRQAAYYERLQSLAPKDTGDSTALEYTDLLTAVAATLLSMGIDNPSPEHSFADTIEIIRIEKGIAPGNISALVGLLGTTAAPITADQVAGALHTGLSIACTDGTTAWRVVGVTPDGSLKLAGPGGDKVVSVSDLGALQLTAIQVPQKIDGNPTALALAQEGVLMDSETLSASWTDIDARTSVGVSGWYLNTVGKEGGDRGATAKALKEKLPTASDAAAYASSSKDKVLAIIDRLLGQAAGEPGTIPPGYLGARAFFDAWLDAASGRDDVADIKEHVHTALRKNLKTHVDRLANKDPASVVTLFSVMDGQRDLMGEPVVNEGLRDALKRALVVASSVPDVEETTTKNDASESGKPFNLFSKLLGDAWPDLNVRGGSGTGAVTPDGAITIQKGLLTADGEGTDDYIHWPGGSSGVTLGKGYDLGSRSAKSVIADLVGAGMTKPLATKISKGAGLKGSKAKAFVTTNKSNIGKIPMSVQAELLMTELVKTTKKARSRATNTKADSLNAASRNDNGASIMSEIQWNSLHPAMVEFLTDLTYQGGYYGYDRIKQINTRLKKHDGDHLAQFKAVRELFLRKDDKDSYMDKYSARLKEGRESGDYSVSFGDAEVEYQNFFRRNSVRLAFLNHVITAMESGKGVVMVDGDGNTKATKTKTKTSSDRPLVLQPDNDKQTKTKTETETADPLPEITKTAEQLWAEANAVPFSAVYGGELRGKMDTAYDRAGAAALRAELAASEELANVWAKGSPGSGLTGLWQAKRLADAMGRTSLADKVDLFFIELEDAVCHTRVDSDAGATYYGERDYDEQLAKQWLDEMYEAYDAMPVKLKLKGGREVTVHLRANYRNFSAAYIEKRGDYYGVRKAAHENYGKPGESATSAYYSHKEDVFKDGLTNDGVQHDDLFYHAWLGKAKPEDLYKNVQDAVDTDTKLHKTLAGFTDENEAEQYMQKWMHYKLGLDCIGFAWNAINGSGMFEDFTPVIYGDNGFTGGGVTGDLKKKKTFACSGFMQTAKQLKDPDQWRTLDVLCSPSHIIVIYDVQSPGEFPGSAGTDRYLLETMESHGGEADTAGLDRRKVLWDGSAKAFYYSDDNGTKGSKISGGNYNVYRAQNSDATNQYLANRG